MIQGPPWDLWARHGYTILDFLNRLLWAAMPDPGIRLTSWFRDQAHNAEVSGAPLSQHRLALAVDVVSELPDAFSDRCRSAGLVPVVYGTHVHVQAFPADSLSPELFRW